MKIMILIIKLKKYDVDYISDNAYSYNNDTNFNNMDIKIFSDNAN